MSADIDRRLLNNQPFCQQTPRHIMMFAVKLKTSMR